MDTYMQRARDATPENTETTEKVLELAGGWGQETIGLDSIRRQCSGYERFVATNHARGADRDALRLLLDALIADQDAREGAVMTKQGRFAQDDLREHGAWIHPDAHGRRIIRFKTLDDQGVPYFRNIPDHTLREGDGR